MKIFQDHMIISLCMIVSWLISKHFLTLGFFYGLLLVRILSGDLDKLIRLYGVPDWRHIVACDDMDYIAGTVGLLMQSICQPLRTFALILTDPIYGVIGGVMCAVPFLFRNPEGFRKVLDWFNFLSMMHRYYFRLNTGFYISMTLWSVTVICDRIMVYDKNAAYRFQIIRASVEYLNRLIIIPIINVSIYGL